MADTIGALKIPADTDGVTDSLLAAVGSYLATYVNKVLGANWSNIAPGSGTPVRAVIPCSIERATFDDARLPALFVMRATDQEERIGDEVYRIKSLVHAFWVPPLSDTQAREARAPFGSSVGKAMHHALKLGRHPYWVVKNDPDPNAPRLGSVLMDIAGLNSEPLVVAVRYDPNVRVKLEGSEPVQYDATQVVIECIELVTYDPSSRGVPTKLAATVDQGGGGFEFPLEF